MQPVMFMSVACSCAREKTKRYTKSLDTKHGVYVQMKLLTFLGSGLLNERKYVGKYLSICEPA